MSDTVMANMPKKKKFGLFKKRKKAVVEPEDEIPIPEEENDTEETEYEPEPIKELDKEVTKVQEPVRPKDEEDNIIDYLDESVEAMMSKLLEIKSVLRSVRRGAQ